MQLWIVIRVRDPERYREWEFMGVFDTREQALAAATAEYDFIGPATLNTRLPDEVMLWPGCFYPNLEPISE